MIGRFHGKAAVSLFFIGLVGTAASESFEVYEIPFEDPGATLFLADANNDGVGDFFTLDGPKLNVHTAGRSGPYCSLTLPADASAVDVADLDGDGANELVAVAGERILVYPLESGSVNAAPRTLFTLDTVFRRAVGRPFPYVLCATRAGRIVLALPRNGAIEYRTPSGALLEKRPASLSQLQSTFPDPPFIAWNVDPPRAGPSEALEFQAVREIRFNQTLPASSAARARQIHRHGTSLQVKEAARAGAENWPWFALRADEDGIQRTYYAAAGASLEDTAVRLRLADPKAQESRAVEYHLGSKRVYRGLVVPPRDRLPDFNSDGYTDLLLWKAPLPGASLGAIVRAAQEGSWPVTVMIHLYDPSRRRYAGKTSGHLQVKLPIAWFASHQGGSPLRNVLLRDFDCDGRTDLAFSPGPGEFSLWLYDEGFGKAPDYRAEFSENAHTVDRVVETAQDGKSTVVFRGETAFFVVALPR